MKKVKTKSNTQRENILIAATKLFYEQGYKNTYLEQIADICEITKPLISYHFNSKAALAREVAEAYNAENKNRISFKVYKHFFNMERYDLQVSTAVEIRMVRMLMLYDEKVFRFTIERADDKYDEFHGKHNTPLYEIHDRRYKLNINHEADEITMIAKAAGAAASAVAFAYKRGEIDCTLEQCLDYTVGIAFRLMRIDDERIEEILAQSKEVISKLDFEIAPYFKIL